MKASFRAVWLILILCTGIVQAQEQTAVPVKDLPNYCEISPKLGGGGQPTEPGFRILAEKGYRTIVNLRAEGEIDLAAEEKLITGLGLKYVAFPFVVKDAKEEQAIQFMKLLDGLKGEKVYVHCHSGNRVGSLVLVDLVLQEGMEREKAEQIAAKVGLSSDQLRNYARQVIESGKKQ